MCCVLQLSNGLHKRILDDHRYIGARKAFGLLAEYANLVFCQIVGRRANAELEHFDARSCVGQRDVDAFLKTNVWPHFTPCSWRLCANSHLEASTKCLIEDPRRICGAEDENSFRVFADALHLHEKLRLYAPC